MKALKKILLSLQNNYAAFSTRERVLVGLGTLGCTWMLFQLTIGELVVSHRIDVARDVQQLEVQRQSATAQQQTLRIERKADPNDALRAEQSALKKLLLEVDESLAGSLSRFVAPERMPALLQDVLGDHPGLKLKLVKRLPARALARQVAAEVSASGDQSDSAAKGQPNLYLHPLRVEFEGRYFDVLAYLQNLEKSPWRFNWRMLEFATETYPDGRAVIEIETLSREQRWLGV
ncbi:MAG: hypothetical protein AB8B93_19300 [Pseudomonadales bacterium]